MGGRIAQVADGLEAELDLLVAGVANYVLDRIEAVDGRRPPVLEEAVSRGVRAGIRDALARLRSSTELPQELPPDLVELARLQAHARREASEFADAWLVGQELFWNTFTQTAERTLADPALSLEVVKGAQLRLNGHAACLSRLFRDAWETQLERADGSDEDTRRRAVSRALDGHWVDAAELGYDLDFHHVAVVADAPSALDAVARRTERQRLLVVAPGGDTWGWLGGATRMSDDELDALVDRQRSDEDGAVAFGEPAAGIAGFAASHEQALEARRIAAETGQRVVRFADLRLLAAVLRDEELAKGFVDRELGALDHGGERTHELRATLRAYLEHGQSIAATAALRRRDRKTIVRQLQAAEREIQHRVSDRCDELLIALRIAEILRRRA